MHDAQHASIKGPANFMSSFTPSMTKSRSNHCFLIFLTYIPNYKTWNLNLSKVMDHGVRDVITA